MHSLKSRKNGLRIRKCSLAKGMFSTKFSSDKGIRSKTRETRAAHPINFYTPRNEVTGGWGWGWGGVGVGWGGGWGGWGGGGGGGRCYIGFTLSVCLSVCPSVRLSVCLSVCSLTFRVRPVASTVQDRFFPYLVQMINSMRGYVACDDLDIDLYLQGRSAFT